VFLDNIQGGILWFNNLTEFPHGALGPVFPIIVAGLHYLNIQVLLCIQFLCFKILLTIFPLFSVLPLSQFSDWLTFDPIKYKLC
jgi:hypothetical protein